MNEITSNPTPKVTAPRRFVSWLLRWKIVRRGLQALAIFVTLLAALYTEENVRGRVAWQRYKAEWEAKGERFDIAAIIPPPVPDVENFAMTPLLKPLLDYTTERKGDSPLHDVHHWRDEAAKKRLETLKACGSNEPKNQGGYRAAKLTDLKAWQEHYRGLTNFSVAPQPQSPGADVLLALTKFDSEIAELRVASQRPHSQFPIHYDESFAALLPHLGVLRTFGKVAQLRALAELELNKPEAALADVKLGLRLSDSVKMDAFLISSLVRIALLEISLQPIWEGLAQRRWNAEQLLELEQQLAKMDLLAEFHQSMRCERNFSFVAIDLMMKPKLFAAMMNADDRSGVAPALAQIAPQGLHDQSKLNIARMHLELILPIVNTNQQRIDMAQMRTSTERTRAFFKGFHPYRVLAKMIMPAMDRMPQKYALMQTSVNEALIACALERYWLKHGAFPEKLDALAPEFMAKIPHDIITGEPLKYRRTEDCQFVLYSVGWNEKNDGGEPAWTNDKPPRYDPLRGDWVWRYPAK